VIGKGVTSDPVDYIIPAPQYISWHGPYAPEACLLRPWSYYYYYYEALTHLFQLPLEPELRYDGPIMDIEIE
jgi:hypothetical protein